MIANERELLEIFVDNLTDYAVVMLDPQGAVLTWNAGARELLKYAPQEIVGRHFSELYSTPDAATTRSSPSLQDALQWGRHEATTRLVRKDGAGFEAKVVLRPLLDSHKRLVGFGMLASAVGSTRRIAAVKPDARDAAAESHRGATKIMVVDDDKHVREYTVRELTHLGYRAVSAASGAEALAMLEAAADVDLLLTDVIMPGGMAGRALADKATALHPGLKVLFASGYFEGALVGKGEVESDAQFLAKPYLRKDLAEKIEEVLRLPS